MISHDGDLTTAIYTPSLSEMEEAAPQQEREYGISCKSIVCDQNSLVHIPFAVLRIDDDSIMSYALT